MKTTLIKVGEIEVDAGLCWIGDPSYILHRKNPAALGRDWADFCAILLGDKQSPPARQFDFDRGHPGLGVVVETGFGDGVYPVYAEVENGQIARVLVQFFEPQEEGADELLVYLDGHHLPLEEFGCFVALSEDRETLFSCPMLADGTPDLDNDHMNWSEVTAPEPEFLDRINAILGTSFQWDKFAGR